MAIVRSWLQGVGSFFKTIGTGINTGAHEVSDAVASVFSRTAQLNRDTRKTESSIGGSVLREYQLPPRQGTDPLIKNIDQCAKTLLNVVRQNIATGLQTHPLLQSIVQKILQPTPKNDYLLAYLQTILNTTINGLFHLDSTQFIDRILHSTNEFLADLWPIVDKAHRAPCKEFIPIIVDHWVAEGREPQDDLLQLQSWLRKNPSESAIPTRFIPLLAEIRETYDQERTNPASSLYALYLEHHLQSSEKLSSFLETIIPLIIEKLPLPQLAPLFFHQIVPVLTLSRWDAHTNAEYIVRFFARIVATIFTVIFGSILYSCLCCIDQMHLLENLLRKILLFRESNGKTRVENLCAKALKIWQENPSYEHAILQTILDQSERLKATYTITLEDLTRIGDLCEQLTSNPDIRIPLLSSLQDNIRAHQTTGATREEYASWINDLVNMRDTIQHALSPEDPLWTQYCQTMDSFHIQLYRKKNTLNFNNPVIPLLDHIAFLLEQYPDLEEGQHLADLPRQLVDPHASQDLLQSTRDQMITIYQRCLEKNRDNFVNTIRSLPEEYQQYQDFDLFQREILFGSVPMPPMIKQTLVSIFDSHMHTLHMYHSFLSYYETTSLQVVLTSQNIGSYQRELQYLKEISAGLRYFGNTHTIPPKIEGESVSLDEIDYILERLERKGSNINTEDFQQAEHLQYQLKNIYQGYYVQWLNRIRKNDEPFPFHVETTPLFQNLYSKIIALSHEETVAYKAYIKTFIARIQAFLSKFPIETEPEEASSCKQILAELKEYLEAPSISPETHFRIEYLTSILRDYFSDLQKISLPPNITQKMNLAMIHHDRPYPLLYKPMYDQITSTIDNAFSTALALTGYEQTGILIDQVRNFIKGQFGPAPLETQNMIMGSLQNLLSPENFTQILNTTLASINDSLNASSSSPPAETEEAPIRERLSAVLTGPSLNEVIHEIATENQWGPQFLRWAKVPSVLGRVTNLFGTNIAKTRIIPGALTLGSDRRIAPIVITRLAEKIFRPIA
ncbi:MAG: hypothetical protein JW769_00505 [Parachlamydiales bacterium]|nr:hypothetical protein [Parachlamydiales bacterium]